MIATRPVHVPRTGARPRLPSERWRLLASILLRLLLLASAGALLQLAWLMIWPLSYRLTHGNDFTYNLLTQHPAIWEKLYDLLQIANTLVPGIEPPQQLDPLVNSLVVAFAVAGIGYLAGVILIDKGVAAVPGALVVILAFEVVYQVTLFLMPGVFTTDIFSYVMYGHIAGVYGLNPYVYPPSYFPNNELLNWIHPIWHDQPSVYGPLWTALSAPFGVLIEPLSLLDRVLAYKLLMNGVHVVNLALVWWLLGRFFDTSPRARLTAFTVFAWNPLMLFDVPGSAHNDGLMVTLLLLGVVPLVLTRARPGNVGWLLGVVSVGLSALIKYTTAIVGLFYVVPWARQLPSWRARFVWLGGAGVLVAAITYVLFRPWLQLPEVLSPILDAAGGKLYSNSVPDLAALTIADQVLDPQQLNPIETRELARFWAKVVTRALFVLYLAWEVRGLWRLSPTAGRQAVVQAVIAASVRAFLVLLLMVLMWILEWYYTWPLALATLLGWRSMLTRVVVGYTLTALPIIYVHHYWSVHMPGALVLVYALPPLALPVIAWLARRLRASRDRGPLIPHAFERGSSSGLVPERAPPT
jgi:alpha-1,6-mannosyltransferase